MPGDITELFNNVNAGLTSPQGSISFGPAGQQGVSNVIPQISTQPIGEPQLIDFLGDFEAAPSLQATSNLEVMPIVMAAAPQPGMSVGSLLNVAPQPLNNTGSLRMIA